MASPGEIAQVVAVLSSIHTTQLVQFGPLTIILYDYVIAFEREVRLFWSRKVTAASALYFTIRYSAILRAGVSLAIISPSLPEESCTGLVKTSNILANTSFLPFAVFSAMRVHALTRSWIIAATVFVLSLAPLVVNFVQYGQGITGIVEPVVGCQTLVLQVTPAELIIFPIVSRVGLVLADLILVLATWRTLAMGPVRPKLGQRGAGSVAGVMLYNGLLYFVLLSVLNLLHLVFRIILAFASGDQSPTKPLTFMTAFTDPLTTVLVSRFLLDLQDASAKDIKLDSDDPLHFGVSDGVPSFVRAVDPGCVVATGALDKLESGSEVDLESDRGTRSEDSYSKAGTLLAAELGSSDDAENGVRRNNGALRTGTNATPSSVCSIEDYAPEEKHTGSINVYERDI